MPPKKQDFGEVLAQFVDSEGRTLQRGWGCQVEDILTGCPTHHQYHF
jgi:hypothetical protein